MPSNNVVPQFILKVPFPFVDFISCKFLSSIQKIFTGFTAYISVKNVGGFLLRTSYTELFVPTATLEEELQVSICLLYTMNFLPQHSGVKEEECWWRHGAMGLC